MVDHEQSSNDNSINKEKTLTNDEIMSQAFIFLLAGYDTVSSTFDFIAYNLATNPDHQETLCLEIDTVLENHVFFFCKRIFGKIMIFVNFYFLFLTSSNVSFNSNISMIRYLLLAIKIKENIN
jgi:hypothetical protein